MLHWQHDAVHCTLNVGDHVIDCVQRKAPHERLYWLLRGAPLGPGCIIFVQYRYKYTWGTHEVEPLQALPGTAAHQTVRAHAYRQAVLQELISTMLLRANVSVVFKILS